MSVDRRALITAGLGVAGLIALFFAPWIGMENIGPEALFDQNSKSGEFRILWRLRVPRVVLAYLAGAGLAVSGMTFQSLFRNPLATPFTLGIASGAALGAALAIRFGLVVAVLGISLVTGAAFAGAMATVALVYGLTRLKRGFSTATMLLAGVAVSFLFSSIILFVQYLSDFAETFRIVRWLMGGLSVVGFTSVIHVAPFVGLGLIIVIYYHRELNLMATGEELAASRGVPVTRVRRMLFLATSLMVGGVVSVCGPIGFVGMMSPHICRLMVGPNHRWLLPASVFFGGLFLVLADIFARTLIAPAEIPVGVLTALIGGPFFLYLLLRGSSDRSLL